MGFSSFVGYAFRAFPEQAEANVEAMKLWLKLRKWVVNVLIRVA